MKKYARVFFGHFAWFLMLSLIGTIAIQLLGGFIYWLGDRLNPRPFNLMLSFKYGIPGAFIFGFYGIYRRWKEPHELESYLDAQEDQKNVKEYIDKQKK